MVKRKLLSTLLQVLCGALVSSQLLGGEECVREYDNARGICISHRDCKRARDDYELSIPLTYCSYRDGVTYICCPGLEKRKSAAMCEQYGELTKEKHFLWSSFMENPVESFTCDPSSPLIFGGEQARAGEFPHMAAIAWRKLITVSFECAGTLISNRHVLTAAHCEMSDGFGPSFVRLGDLNLRTRDDDVMEVDIDIEEFICHENYSSLTEKNDIALIKLVKSVEFTENIRPACLWQTSSVHYTKASAAGWGALESDSRTSDELMKVELDIIDTSFCNILLTDSLSLPSEMLIDGTQLCAGVLAGGKDTCQGDSGGPLHVSIPNGNPCLFHVIGITSYGATKCGSPDTPAVYTRVSAYLDWIEKNVWP